MEASTPPVMSLLCVHSPLLGPSSWDPFARHAAQRGIHVAAPDLTGAASSDPPDWRALTAAAVAGAAELGPPIAVVGHSGAGAFLPQIGLELGGQLGALVFVDAVIPPLRGAYRTPAAMHRLLDDQTTADLLVAWLDWWPSGLVEEMLPAASDRAALRADMPLVPRSFFDEDIPVPEAWSTSSGRYLQLSDAYQVEYHIAGSRGWPRTVIEGTHLSIYTHPDQVLTAVETLALEPRT